MENITKKLQFKRILYYILTSCWMITVFVLSNENGEETQNTSSIIVDFFSVMFTKITNYELNLDILNIISFVIRKLAHFILYFIGTISIFLLFSTYNMSQKEKSIYTILFCILYACTDEVHQTFLQGRNGSFLDVIIDSIGCISCLIFICKIYKFKE